MPTFRVHKTKNFTVMSNTHLRDKNLSLKAKGLLSVMLSLPGDWDYSIAGLAAISMENETAIKSALCELKSSGYVVVTKENPTKTNGGRIKYNYEVYEEPQEQGGEKQGVENLGTEFLEVEIHGQLNTNKLSTDKLNTDELKSTVKTQSKDCAKVKTCSSKDSHDTNKARTREEMLEKERDMVREFCKICFTTIDNATIRDAVARGFAHYMERYRAYFNKVHPILTDKTLRKVCITLSEIRDDEFFKFDDISVYTPDENGVTGLREIIDEHFRREHKDYSDYSIAHFANSKYLTTIARGVIGY